MLERLSEYRVMWVFVSFDLPTNTKVQRRAAALFRKDLVADGFVMFQFSVYVRHCASMENAEVHMKRVEAFVPSEGKVSVLALTDRQYGAMRIFYGKKQRKEQTRPVPVQLEFF